MEMKITEIAEKSKELLNKKVSLSGFSTEETFGPKIHIDGKKWFYLKDSNAQFLCLSNPREIKKGSIAGYIRREAGISYIEV